MGLAIAALALALFVLPLWLTVKLARTTFCLVPGFLLALLGFVLSMGIAGDDSPGAAGDMGALGAGFARIVGYFALASGVICLSVGAVMFQLAARDRGE